MKRWIALTLLGALAFSHASVSMAACSIERGAIGQAIAVAAAEPCDCGTSATGFGPLHANRCVAHCTSDLQLAGLSIAIVRSAAETPALYLPRMGLRAVPRTGLDAPPPGAVPRRILLHSFLI